MQFLNGTGLKALWAKIKGTFLSLNGGTLNGDLNIEHASLSTSVSAGQVSVEGDSHNTLINTESIILSDTDQDYSIALDVNYLYIDGYKAVDINHNYKGLAITCPVTMLSASLISATVANNLQFVVNDKAYVFNKNKAIELGLLT